MSLKFIDCKICKKRIMQNVWTMHYFGKKHLHYTPKKITVTGNFDSSKVDEVHEYFSSFGTIGDKNVTVHNGTVSIVYSFQDQRAHSKIIHKDHRIFNQTLKITWEEVKSPLPGPNSTQPWPKSAQSKPSRTTAKINDAENSTKILESVKLATSFTDQLLTLQQNLQVDKEEFAQKKKLILDDLVAALAPMFALSSVNFFGSSVTGLDMKGSDLDVYIANVKEDTRPEVATLKVIRQLIFKCRKFCDVLLISGAKIPIIKCIHARTQICCDLNIRNKLSVCNSYLINYYLNLDDKLRPLMMFIKYWADVYDLKKVNFFSSYALYMLVIFYLQQEPYNIPSVKELQSDVAPDLVDGWNCAFESKAFSNSILKNENLFNLVAGFFRFYSKFDYITYVVSPYIGCIIKKIDLLKPYELGDGWENYINNKQDLNVNSGICIQDPFELGRNVAGSVPLQCVGKFTAICKTTTELFEQKNEKELLFKVLTQKPVVFYKFSIEKQDIETLTQKTLKILTEVLNLKVTQTKNNFACSGVYHIWDNRVNILKNLLTQLPPETSNIEREIAATKCIIKYFPSNLPLNFTVDLNIKEDKVDFILRQSNKKSKIFLHASHFFYVKLMDLINEENLKKLEDSAVKEDVISQPEIAETTKMVEKTDETVTSLGEVVLENQNEEKSKTEAEIEKDSENEAKEAEEEEEDVPADFFDDFSNEDFMDGLDIVDAWDDDKLLHTKSSPTPEKKSSEKSIKSAQSPIRLRSKSPEKRRKRVIKSRSKSLKRHKRSNSYNRIRSKSKSHEKIRMDRRDPEKTRRDINKDKIKCAKDRELKLVNDKLKIVETGLVPPGMEMEADLNSLLKDKDKHGSKGRSSVERKERERKYIRRSGSRELRKLRLSPSPRLRVRSPSPLRIRVRSPSPARIRIRSPSPSRNRVRSPSPRTRAREREVVYRSCKRSESNLSDREIWIRSAGRKRTRSRSRSRSRSATRRLKAKKKEEAKKKSFLEEIRDKLNETSRPTNLQSTTNYLMSNYTNPTPPAPVPPPTQYFPPPNPHIQQYDQSFFIGESYQNVGFNMMPNTGNVMQVVPAPVQMPVQSPVQVPPAPIINSSSPNVNFINDVQNKSEKKIINEETAEDIGKLFADKKISLSDFLTITAKGEVRSSSPEHLQKKIRVISRCQDAIKAMSDDRSSFSGRLLVKPCLDQKNKTDVKYQSPLRRKPIIRFQFTSPAKTTDEVDSFTIALDKILRKVGISREIKEADDVIDLTEDTTTLSKKVSFLKKAEVKSSECEECRIRKLKTFVEVGSQCVDNKEFESIGIQVNEEDISPSKGLPKNESLAYLTPAQLLGKEKDNKEKEVEKEEIIEKKETPPKIETNTKPVVTTTKRGGFRKTLLPGRPMNYYDFNNEFEYRGRPMYDEVDNFSGRYGGGPPRFPTRNQGYMEREQTHMARIHQFREEGNFTDFTQPFRGRGGRMPPPRY